MAMQRKTITISESMDAWVKAQIDSGRYGNDSEYFRDLIRHDQEKRAHVVELQALIKEGIDSGISNNTVPEIMARVEEKLRQNGEL